MEKDKIFVTILINHFCIHMKTDVECRGKCRVIYAMSVPVRASYEKGTHWWEHSEEH